MNRCKTLTGLVLKKALVFILLIITLPSYTQPDPFAWAHTLGNVEIEDLFETHVDESRNYYVSGRFTGTVDFDPGVGDYSLSSSLRNDGSSQRDTFLSKFDENGNHVWTRKWNSIRNDDAWLGPTIVSIQTDSLGNIYMGCRFIGSLDVDPGNATINHHTSAFSVLVLSLDSEGNYRWNGLIDGFQAVGLAGMVIDESEAALYLAGTYSSASFFGSSNRQAWGGTDVYLSKISILDGSSIWDRYQDNDLNHGVDDEWASAITLLPNGNIVMAGCFDSPQMRFTVGSSITKVAVAPYNGFICVHNSSGSVLAQSELLNMGGGEELNLSDMVSDALGNIYVIGTFDGISMDFDPTASTNLLTTAGNDDIFVSNFSSNLTYNNSIRIGNSTLEKVEDAKYWNNDLYITGDFNGTLDFDPGAGLSERTVSGLSDVFVLSLSTSLSYNWVETIGGIEDEDGHSLEIGDNNGEYLYVAGTFSGSMDLDWGAPVVTGQATPGTHHDIFFAKYGLCNTPFPDNELPDILGICQIESADVPIPTATTCDGTIVNGTTTTTFPVTDADTTIIEWTFENAGAITRQQQTLIIDGSLILDNESLPNLNRVCEVNIQDVTIPTATACDGSTIEGVSNDFPVSEVGTNVVTWIFTNNSGQDISQTQNVIIFDEDAPVPDAASLPDISSSCLVSFLESPTATDDCDGSIDGVANVSFPITAVGQTVVTWTFTDNVGNEIMQTQNVIVLDDGIPVVDIELLPDILSFCSASSPIVPTATDNCDGSIDGVPDAVFPITTIGQTIVTWTFTDNSGNAVTQTQNFIVNDVAPVPDIGSLPDIVSSCSATSPIAPTATDDCDGSISAVPDISFPINTIGQTVVTWTYTDSAGNEVTQTQNIIVTDVAPVPDSISLSDISSMCEVALPVVPTATDDCDGSITATSNVPFPISTPGQTVVTWTFTDSYGNETTQTQNVSVTNEAPVPDLVSLDSLSGTYSIPAPATPTATDDCSGAIIGTTAATFPYDVFGTNEVVWTYDDGDGNVTEQIQVMTIGAGFDPMGFSEFGGPNTDQVHDVFRDLDGNTLITGEFRDSIDVDPGPGVHFLYSAGGRDAFVIKLDRNGSLLWTKRFGDISNENGKSIVADANGNVYLTGEFALTVDFDGGPAISNLISYDFRPEVFVLKMDSDGNFIWARRMLGRGTERGETIEVDALNNIYCSFTFNDSLDVDMDDVFDIVPATATRINLGVTKFNSNGDLQWTRTIGGSENMTTNSMAVNDNGVYVAGTFWLTIDFDPSANTFELSTVNNSQDGFVLNLDLDGNFQWVNQIGGSTSSDYANGIITDAFGSVYVTGTFGGTVDMDPSASTFNLTSSGGPDAFVQKLDANGNFIWATQSADGGLNVESNDIAVSQSGDVFISGNYRGTVDFDNGPGDATQVSTNDTEDVFALHLNATNGNFIQVWTRGGVDIDEAHSISFSQNQIAIGGLFHDAMYRSLSDSIVSTAFQDGFYEIIGVCTHSNPIPFTVSLDTVFATCSMDTLFAPSAINNCGEEIVGVSDVVFPIDTTTQVVWNYYGNGYDTTQIQMVVITDAIPPLADVADLPNVTGECTVDLPVAPTSTDNCGSVITGIPDITGPFSNSTTITWTYTDNAGNESSQIQEVVIADITAPLADVASLSDLSDECSANLPMAPTATDNCEGAITGIPDVTGPFTSSQTITWTYTDGSGNSSTQTQEVVIADVTAPVADVAMLTDVNGECSVNLPTAPTATDNCEGGITGIPDVTGPFTSSQTITWTYTDGSGNSSTQTQEVVIADVTAPVADSAMLTDVNGECSVNLPTAPTATDNCEGAIAGIPDVTGPFTSSQTITWTYTDESGNSSTQTQEVVIADVTAPVADVAMLADVNGECSVNLPAAPTATDNCEGAITGIPDVTGPFISSQIITWTYTDGSGNSSTQTQEVVIADATAPVADVVMLSDVNGECSADLPMAPTATDNCEGTITGVPDVAGPFTSSQTITWTYTDGSGNSSIQTQEVVIADVTAPVADVAMLADVNGECSANLPTAPTATDNCEGAITGIPDVTGPFISSQIITWTYTDGSGNSSTQTQEVVIADATAPVADVAMLSDVNGECSADLPMAPTATDNCEGAITGVPDVVGPFTSNTTITWTYTDGSGNSSIQTQEVVIADVTAPVADVAMLADVNGECSVNLPLAPTATDNCEGTIAGIPDITGPFTSSQTITWTYSDESGNNSTQTQEVLISDITAPNPDIANLLPVQAYCVVESLTPPTASDNCSGDLVGQPNISFPITQIGTTIVTWTYTDANGNTATQQQTVLIEDALLPTEPNLPEIVSECSLIENDLSIPTASDCETTINGSTMADFPIEESVLITWQYDNGSQQIEQTQQITIVEDMTSPELPSLDAMTSECSVTLEEIEVPIAIDNCDGEIQGGTTAIFPLEESQEVLWSFMDQAGNQSSLIQEVIIEPIDNSVVQEGNILTAQADGDYSYQWVECGTDDTLIADATDRIFEPSVSSSYKVIVNNGICAVESECIDISILGLDDYNPLNASIYPNPFSDELTIERSVSSSVQIQIIDSSGRILLTRETNKKIVKINMSEFSIGIYYINLADGEFSHKFKVLRNQ